MNRFSFLFVLFSLIASELCAENITLLGNYAPVLPLATEKTAVLSIGQPNSDQAFLKAMTQEAAVKNFRISNQFDSSGYEALVEELKQFQRVVVSVTAESVDARMHRRFLASLDLPAPIIYVVFSSYRMLHLLSDPLEKAAAVLFTEEQNSHSQQQAARILFGKEEAGGKLDIGVEELFPAGSGTTLSQPTTARLVPEDYGIKSHILNRKADLLIRQAMKDTVFPGCQLLILKDGQPIFDRCYGVLSPKCQTPVTPHTIYDLSELSQSAGTLLAIMKLYDEGKLSLDEKVSTYLPVLRPTNKKGITIRELLLHESGLMPYIRFYELIIDDKSVQGPYFQGFADENHATRSGARTYACSNFRYKQDMISPGRTGSHTLQMSENMWVNKSIVNSAIETFIRSKMQPKRYLPGSTGFILLQQVAETISKMPLDRYLQTHFYEPMGLSRTLYLPLQRYGKEDIAPTASNEYLRRQDIHGYVENEAAACLGGVAGNAGLFSTAHETAQIYAMLLNKGVHSGKRYLSEETCRLFTTEKSVLGRQGLGFDKPDPESPHLSPCAPSAPPEVFGQASPNGTCVWADPVNNLTFVLLTNATCPNAWNDKIIWAKTREKIQELIYKSLQ